jgi:hypothetical protein
MSEPTVDSDTIPLAATLPLPFRVLFLGGLGVLGWATNLHGLAAAGLDAPGALDLQLPGAQPAHAPVYRLAAAYWAWVLATWALFRAATGGVQERADAYKHLPALAMLGALAILLLAPADACRRRERDLFLLCVPAICFGPALTVTQARAAHGAAPVCAPARGPADLLRGRGAGGRVYVLRQGLRRRLALRVYACPGREPRRPARATGPLALGAAHDHEVPLPFAHACMPG